MSARLTSSKMAIKVAVAGSHSTGKTTFLQRAQRALKDAGHTVAYVHDSAADAQELGFPILTGHNFGSTAWLMARAIQSESEAALKHDVILVDRPVHDALGYLLAALQYSERSIAPDQMRTLETICEGWATQYDLLFLTSIDPSIPLGEGRDPDLGFRTLASEKVRDVIERFFPSRWFSLGDDSMDRVLTAAKAHSHRDRSN